MSIRLLLRSPVVRFRSCLLVTAVSAAPVPAFCANVFLNEIHYDNLGTDTGEAIEIAGPSGMDLTGWALFLYNGNDGTTYGSRGLAGRFPDQQQGFGTLAFGFSAGRMQNGAPDGIALVDGADAVVQFLSYEGSFTASGGPATGITSTDIGVSEAVDTPIGFSLQLTGSGNLYSDFTWAPAQQNTFAAVNAGQTFVPLPAALPLFLSGIAGFRLVSRRFHRSGPR